MADKTGNGAQVDGDVDRLKSDMGLLREDLSALKEHLLGAGRNSARSAKQQLEERYESSVDALKETIDERPMTSLLVAFGVGLLAGKLMSK